MVTRKGRPLIRYGRGVIAIGVMLAVTSCASLRAGENSDPALPETAIESPVPAPSPPAAAQPDAGPVDQASVAADLQRGVTAGALPDGFHVVDQLLPEGDAQPAQVFATAAYEAAASNASTDQGPTVIVRTVPMSPDVRASAPTTTSSEVTAEPRDDIAPGAVIYTLKGADVPSITVPAGDVDFIIAGTDVDTETLIAFAKAVIR